MIYTIFKEGVRANSENKLCSDNPYVSGSLEYVNWSKGWWAAENSSTVNLDDFLTLSNGDD